VRVSVDALLMLTIYAHPADYPEGFVVRRWAAHDGQAEPAPCAHLCATLAEARTLARQLGGSIALPRAPSDAPCIVETWL
jgi:hypothetical protein